VAPLARVKSPKHNSVLRGILAAAVTEWQLVETQGYLTVLTARYKYSKELSATTYWTLIGPTFLNSPFRSAHQCLTSFPRTSFEDRGGYMSGNPVY